jgi:hypothetical protein
MVLSKTLTPRHLVHGPADAAQMQRKRNRVNQLEDTVPAVRALKPLEYVILRANVQAFVVVLNAEI